MLADSSCPRCRAAFDAGNLFCRQCGNRLDGEAFFPSPGDDHWRALFDLAHDPMLLIDGENRVVMANPPFERLSGYSRGELEGRQGADTLLRPTAPWQFAAGETAPSEAAAPHFVVTLLAASGEERPVEATFHLVGRERFVVTLREVAAESLTQQRLLGLWQLSSLLASSLETELVLPSLSEQLVLLLDITHLSVALLDGERGEIETVVEYCHGQVPTARSSERNAGRKLAELPIIARAVAELEPIFLRPVEPADGAAISLPEGMAGTIAWAALVPMVARGRAVGLFTLADRRVERTLSSLELSICQTLANQVGAAMENARLFQEALRSRVEVVRLRDYHQCILDGINFGVLVITPRGVVQFWNRRMEAMTGLAREAVLGQNLFTRVEHLGPYRDNVLQIGRSRKEYRIDRLEHPGVRDADAPGGDEPPTVTESYLFRPLAQGTRLAGILGVVEDISVRVRMDQQFIRSERMAAVGELAAGVAHNFNNILAAIGGDAQLLKMTAEEMQLPHSVMDTALMIYQEAMRGGSIAHDLLSFARGSEPSPRVIAIEPLLDEVIRLVTHHPSSKDVQIERRLSEHLPTVHADPRQLHQVFMNITLNAVQAMAGSGTLTIRARVRASDEDADLGVLEVTFTDTGVGIPAEELRRIFDPFYSHRQDGSLGTGLGLTVTLSMVRGMGGTIHVTSDIGRGTTFTVTLPIVERRTDKRNRPLPRGKILIVDDEPSVRRTVSSFLAKRGYEVHTAQDGEEAVVRAEQALALHPYDVVLMDLMLPKIDGVRATSLLKARDPQAQVIVLTGVTSHDKVLEALERGARFSFTKPLNFAELLNVVDSLRKIGRR